MSKSENKLKTETSKLEDAIGKAKSQAFLLAEKGSDSPPFKGSSSEIQIIGTLAFPKWIWSMAWEHQANSVRLKLGGEIVQITAKGQWSPPPPTKITARPLPEPRKNESHESYALRTWAFFQRPTGSDEFLEWKLSRTWEGETSKMLLKKLCEGRDLSGYEWRIISNQESQT